MSSPRIFCLFAAPLVDDERKPLTLLNIGSERDVILDVLRVSKREGEILFETATTANLMRCVASDFNILIYSGHVYKEHLAFEDDRGGLHAVYGQVLEDAVRMAGTFRLALVSACHSEGIAKSLVAGGVPHVVAIRLSKPVMDYTAKVFTREFFRFLLAGKSVNFSYNTAKMTLASDSQLQKMMAAAEVSG